MIRFSCPQCGKALKVPGEQAGSRVVCPRCEELCVAPAATAGRDEGHQFGQPRGLFRGMSVRVRWAVVLVAAVGISALLVAVLSPVLPVSRGTAEATVYWAVPLVVGSVVVLLVILHGHATGCPACERWWSREEVGRGFADREVFERGGVSFARSVSRTNYQCGACGHRWAVTDAEEYREPTRGGPQGHRG